MVPEPAPALLEDKAKSSQPVNSEEQKVSAEAGGVFLAEPAGLQAAEEDPCSAADLLTEVDAASAEAELDGRSSLRQQGGDAPAGPLHR